MNSIIYFTTFYFFVALVTSSKESREAQFKRITKYELVHFNLELLATSNIITFDAFGQHYQLQLIENPDINPSILRHTDGNLAIKHGLHQFYTHLTESCHFFGKVLNTNTSSNAAISACEKRGIRGHVTAFDRTISIKPSRYYTDFEYDRFNYHDLGDEHLVYDHADYNTTGLSPRGDGEPMHRDRVRVYNGTSSKYRSPPSRNDKTRRLVDSNGVVEVFSFSDVSHTNEYKSVYSSNWYDHLVSDLSDIWNAVGNFFKNPEFCTMSGGRQSCSRGEWSSTFKGVGFRFVEIQAITSWSGLKKKSDPRSSARDWNGPKEVSNSYGDGYGDYLDDFIEYITAIDNPGFDHATLFTAKSLLDDDDTPKYGGIALIGSMCRGAENAAVVTTEATGGVGASQRMNRLVAHELGHNFGAWHDGPRDNGCDDTVGMMGSNDDTYKGWHGVLGWSSCTREDIAKYAADNNELTCLKYSNKGLTKRESDGNDDDDDDDDDTDRWGDDDDDDDNGGGGGGGGCCECTERSSSAGCSKSRSCERQVCGLDDYCCDRRWESTCVNIAEHYCGRGMGGDDDDDDDDRRSSNWDDCVQVSGNREVNGYYEAAGRQNSRTLYTNGEYYLFRDLEDGEWYWTIEEDEDDRYTTWDIAWSECDDIEDCGSWDDGGIRTSTCNGGYRFQVVDHAYDTSCLDGNNHEDTLCVYNDGSLWNDVGNDQYKEFTFRYCWYGKPVYSHYWEETEVAYYLYLNEYYKYSDDNETSSQWVISLDEIGNNKAFCDKWDLMECNAGSWSIRQSEDDHIELVPDGKMTISDKGCPNNNNNNEVAVMVVATVLIIAVICVVICVSLYWRAKQKQSKIIKHIELEDVEDVEDVEDITQTLN